MLSSSEISESLTPLIPSGGFCRNCQEEHLIPAMRTKGFSVQLMKKLEHHKRLDFLSPAPQNPLFPTSGLFGNDRGKMFGVLEGIDTYGKIVVLHAFSGQFNGHWNIPGWVPPLFHEQIWQNENFEAEKQIKKLTASINSAATSAKAKVTLKRHRKRLSQQLMSRLHELYTVKNFRGENKPLSTFYSSQRGAPTGAGDCCAPKLLNHAINNNIIPLGLSEFYWGRTNLSKSRHHGSFYPACSNKCKPLLGFMLCGLNQRQSLLEFFP